jgi:hypothetical protein
MEFDPVFGLQVSARLADTGSLGCVDRADPDTTDGLFVQVSGLTDDATSGVIPGNVPCGQSIGRDTLGNLFAFPEGAVAVKVPDLSLGCETVGVGTQLEYDTNTIFDAINSWDVEAQNPFNCPAWCFYTVSEMRIVGERRGAVADQPFYVTGFGTLSVNGNLLSGAVNRQDVHGVWTGTVETNQHFHGWDMHALFPLAAGQCKLVSNRITIQAAHHFDMFNGDGGVCATHAAMIFVRQDSLPVRGTPIPPGPCVVAP